MLITLSKFCSVTSSNGKNTLYPAFAKTPSKCPNSRLIVANIVSRSVRSLTSARTARLPAPSIFLVACSVRSFMPQMATRAPSLANSRAAASPIPLLPPVIRIFLSASLPTVVAPVDYTYPCRLHFLANLTDAAYQLRETRSAEGLLNGVVRSVEDWPKPSFHCAGNHATLMHLAAHRKNSALAFNRLVDLIECYARCRVSETDAAVAALAKSDQSLSLEELEDFPHHDRVGLEALRDCLRSRPLVAGVSDETHDVDGTRQTTVRGHKQNRISYSQGRQAPARLVVSASRSSFINAGSRCTWVPRSAELVWKSPDQSRGTAASSFRRRAQSRCGRGRGFGARGGCADEGGDSQPGEREWGEVRVGIAVFSTLCGVTVMTRTPSVGAMQIGRA